MIRLRRGLPKRIPSGWRAGSMPMGSWAGIRSITAIRSGCVRTEARGGMKTLMTAHTTCWDQHSDFLSEMVVLKARERFVRLRRSTLTLWWLMRRP